jgi:cytochrome P450
MKYDLFSEEFFARPDATLHRMRARDPVYFDPTLEAWVLTRYQDIRRVLRDPAFSSERGARSLAASSAHVKDRLGACYRFLSQCLIFSDAPRHTRLRSVIGKVFTPAAVAALEPFVGEELERLIGDAVDRGGIEVIGDLAFPLTSATSARLIGLPLEFVPRMARWSNLVFPVFGTGLVSEQVVDAAHESIVECRDAMRGIIASSGSDAPGLLGRLLEAERAGLLDEDEVIASCVMLVIGGHESTAHTIGNGLLALLRHPEELEKLNRRPGLLDAAVEELMRYDGSAVSLQRRARTSADVGGTTIEAGQLVFAFLRAANRDPEVFAEPDRLNIERGDNPHLALGYGAHFCSGAVLARMQMKRTIGALIPHAPELDISDASLRWVPSLATRGVHALPVRLGAGRSSTQKSSNHVPSQGSAGAA